MQRIISIILCLVTLIFFEYTPALAVTFTISPSTTSILDNQSLTLTTALAISSSANKDYYLKTAFSHPLSTSSYFGFEKNHLDYWYNGSDYTQYKKITMDATGNWNGTVEVMPDATDSAYKGTGDYNLKLRYYTSAGNLGGTESNIVTITITTSATPTPTPTATPVPTATATPTQTPSPTSTPTPTPKPATIKPTPSPTGNSIATDEITLASDLDSGGSVLAAQDVSSDTVSSPSNAPQQSNKPLQLPIGIGIILGGLGLISYSAFNIFKSKSSATIIKEDEENS